MPDKPKSYELIPPEGDPNVGKEVFAVLAKIIADKIRLGLHDRWFRNYQLRRNKHWKAKSPQGVPLVSANLLYTHIQRTTNTMTDNDPTFNVVAVGKIEDQQKEQLQDLQHCTEHWWRDQEQQDVFESSCINGEQYGIAIEKVIFNPDIEYRLGEVEALPIDPFHFGWYPVKLASCRDLQKVEALVHYYPVSVRSLKSKYPALADRIKPDTDIIKDLKDDERREIIGDGGANKGSVMSSFLTVVRELLNFVSGTGGEDDEDETLYCEMWVRDKSTVSLDITLEGGRIQRVTTPKYTGEIRYILVCSGGVVLEDKDNPNINPNLTEEQAKDTFLYDKFPFCAANSVKDTSNAWGLCYDDETEILTKTRGFVKFVDLDPSDLVATRNKDKEFEWQSPAKYTIEPYSGAMYHFKSRSMDLCVTPNHRMLVGILNGTKKTRAERVMLAEELADGLNHERKIPVTSLWKTTSPELGTVVFEKSAMKPSKDIVLSGDDYCALLGAYLAEGNLHSNSGIEIAQRKASKGYSAYKELFDRIGVPHDGKRWRIYGQTLRDHFKQFGHAADKYIPIKIKDLPVRQLKIVWDFFVLGDGNIKKNPNVSGRGKRGSDNDVTHITTVSRRLADDLVEVGQKLGWSVSVSISPACVRYFKGRKPSPCQQSYKLCCRYSDYMAVKVREVTYTGNIYCVTVPNGIVYVRRNGKPSWCGNSDYEQLEWLNMEINKCLSQMVLEKDWASRKKLLNPKDSGVPSHHFTNFTGIIEPSSAMSAQGIRWLETPASSVDYEKTAALFKDLFFLVSGTFEIDQAQGPGRDVIAYKAIAALLERAATMMRGKIRSYSRLIRDRGRMYLSHVMNFYTEERWITYTDKDGKEASKPIIGSSMIMPAKLTVVSGSTLPISRIQKREEALALYKEQAIDQTELLDSLDWTNRSEVVTRMAQGPLGQVLQKLMMVGMPQELADYAKTIGQADPKDLEKAIKEGQIPPFMDFIQQLMAQLQGQAQGPDPAQQAELSARNEELKKLSAEVEKAIAERDLLVEKALTEQVNQQVKLAGVKFDEDTLKMQRAKLVADIEAEAAGRHLEGVKTGLDFVSKQTSAQTNRPGFNEKSKKSDNVEE